MKRKIRVLQVVGQLRIGGAETVAMNIYRYIDRSKFEMHYLVYGNVVGDYEHEVIALGGKVIHIEYDSIHIQKYKKNLACVISENGPYDIIHSHMMFHNGLVLKIAKNAGIPVRISHSHSANDGGENFSGFKAIIRAAYLGYMRRLIWNNANMLIACGEDSGVCLYGEIQYHSRGALIRNGIDIDKYLFNVKKRKEMRRENSLEGKRAYACIGHFDRVKNHVFLIELFEKISLVDKDGILILLGDGKLRLDIEKMCREKKLDEKIIFKGNVNNVNEWMQAIDFLLMPSLYEGIPVTLIEAQAAGLKCFVSDRVSKEVDVTGNVQYIPLDIQRWMYITNESMDYNRQDYISEKLINRGYDVKSNIKKLEDEYKKLMRVVQI